MLPDNVKPGAARRTVSRLGRTCEYPRYLTATVRQGRGLAFFAVATSMQIPVAGAVQYEPMSRTRIASVPADTPSRINLERYERASQTTARLIRNGQAYCVMLMELPDHPFSHHDHVAPGGRVLMIPSAKTFRESRSFAAIPRHTVTTQTDLRWVVASTTGHAAEA